MLEDNLDQESYKAMKDLANVELTGIAEIIRNPCLNCYDGNDAETFGSGSESHSPWDISKLGIRDGFTLDGYGYRFPDEAASGRALDLENVKQLLQQSVTNGVQYFGLWRSDRQGVVDGVLTPPDERTYAAPTDLQIGFEIELLRHGL